MSTLLLFWSMTFGCSDPPEASAPPPAEALSVVEVPEEKPSEAPEPEPLNAPDIEQPAVCLRAFTDDASNEAFQTIGLSAPEGCKFEGISTQHALMKIRWESPPFQAKTEDKTIVEFAVVPTECADTFEIEAGGSLLSVKALNGADAACPKQWAQLVQLVQGDKLPKPISIGPD